MAEVVPQQAACRFCWHNGNKPPNILVAPCACIGSIQYVHKHCLKKWRQTTPNPMYAQICNLCMQPYALPGKWPLELLPVDNHDGSWFFLSRSYLMILFVHALHLHILVHSFTPDMTLTQALTTKTSTLSFQILTNLCVFLYGMYYKTYWTEIRSKSRYVMYWWRNQLSLTDTRSPRQFLFLLLTSYVALHCVSVFPFGMLFLFSLSRIHHMHVIICKTMNTDAQLDIE
mgnify:CR=1 FL=1